MPTPPKRVGREFVRQYYTIMNKSPENLHCFYTEEANFVHDDVDTVERRTISANGKRAIRDVMVDRSPSIRHTSTKIHAVDTIETLDDGLLVQINGEISYNEQPMRPFSQTCILIPKSPFQYFVQNDIFRYCDFDLDAPNSRHDSISTQTKPTSEDWGTQCEEYIETYEENMEHRNARAESTREDIEAPENEVKLDTSDSGLSSDAEKAIMDMQSLNLKSILQEPRSITKERVQESVMKRERDTTPPGFIETVSTEQSDVKSTGDDVSENHSQLFRDSCILTIGNVINPNIEFDDAKRDEIAQEDKDKSQESADTASTAKSEDNNGKRNYRKRKDKRKARHEMKEKPSHEESSDGGSKSMVETNQSLPEQTAESEEPVQNREQIKRDEPSMDVPAESNASPNPVQAVQTIDTPVEEIPKAPEAKTYADLAKTGKNEWIDELADRRRRDSVEHSKRPPLTRRSSRIERPQGESIFKHFFFHCSHTNKIQMNIVRLFLYTTAEASHSNRSSPKCDLLQVFIGNIPHTANEDGIRKMFSRFGRLTRLQLHSNTRKEWLPRYAFISYENVQSVQLCLMKKVNISNAFSLFAKSI